MIDNTEYFVNVGQVATAAALCKDWTGKNVLNMPTGDFFYDPWKISPQYEGTIFEDLLSVLPDVGEARIIRQECGTCYQAHSDIDDRYHLNLAGDHACLIDLDDHTTYDLKADGKYYLMNAGKTHSAANFGEQVRFQLVVRKLLRRADWVDCNVEIIGGGDNPRFAFDKYVSPLLNQCNKRNVMNNFTVTETGVKFTTNKVWANLFLDHLPVGFKIIQD